MQCNLRICLNGGGGGAMFRRICGKEFHGTCSLKPTDFFRYFILTGAASIACAETLRQEGFKGKVVIATKESCLPYDRPKLSKALNTTADAIALRDKIFYSVYDIQVDCGKEVSRE